MNVIGAKILAGLIFFVLSFLFGWMPYLCFRRFLGQSRSVVAERDARKRPLIVQCLHSFASGVMIGTSLLHLLPEALGAVRKAFVSERNQRTKHLSGRLEQANTTIDYKAPIFLDNSSSASDIFPIAECLVALGFLFIYIIDSVIRSCSKPVHGREFIEDGMPTSADPRDHSQQSTSQLPDVDPSLQKQEATAKQWRKGSTRKTKPSYKYKRFKPDLAAASYELVPRNGSQFQSTFAAADAEDYTDDTSLITQSDSDSDNTTSFQVSSSVEVYPKASWKKSQEVATSSQLRSVALVSALCIHGFFDGIMLGLQTSMSVVMSLMLALCIHKSFVAIGLSLTLLGTSDNKSPNCIILLYIFLFASVAPLGLLVSSAFLHKAFGTSSDLEISFVPGCLQAFAVGTFLYVTFSETTEHAGQRRNFSVVVVDHMFLLVGFSLMAALRASLAS